MSVMLSAASCPDWAAKLTGMADVPALITAAQQADENAGTVWFYRISPVSVRRTTTRKRKGYFGLTHQHGPAELARAVLEGVGYALADGMDVVHDCGLKPASITNRRRRTQQLLAPDALISVDCSWTIVPGAMWARRLVLRGWRR